VKWGGWNEKRLKQTPPPLSSPVNGEEEMGKFLIFIIVKFFAPILILLRQFGEWFKRVEKPPSPLSSPVNGEDGN